MALGRLALDVIKQSFSESAEGLVRHVTLAEAAPVDMIVDPRGDAGLALPARWSQSWLRGARPRRGVAGEMLGIVDAFAGGGGLGLGVCQAAEAVGLSPRFMTRIDADAGALAIHRYNLGGGPALAASIGDLVDYALCGEGRETAFAYPPELVGSRLANAEGCDLFIAGPPCQGHSNLNNHTRRDDPRNDLFVAAAALGVSLGARAILLENVPTIQNARGAVVETALAALTRAGYAVDRAVMKADALGAAQRRTRLFLLAIRGSDSIEGVLEATARELSLPAMTVMEAIGDLVDIRSTSIFDTPAATSATNRQRIEYLFANDLYDLPDSERPDCHRDGTSYTSVYGRMHPNRPGQTITTGFGASGQGRYIHPIRPRLLTPHEAARLQGFPDGFDFAPPELPVLRRHLLKWIGDAVPSTLGYAAGLAAMSKLLH